MLPSIVRGTAGDTQRMGTVDTGKARIDMQGQWQRALDGLILDLDGTLADTIPLSLATLREVLQEHADAHSDTQHSEPDDVSTLNDAGIIALFGPSEEGILQLALGDAWQPAMERFVEIYQRRHVEVPDPFPGIVPLLERLRAAGVRLALVTGKGPRSAQISLDVLGLAHLFDIIETGQPHGGVKPAAIQRILAAWDLPPERCAYLGDAVSDMHDAHACGVPALAAAWAAHVDPDLLDAAEPLARFNRVEHLSLWLDGRLPDGRWPVVLSHVQAAALLTLRNSDATPDALRSSYDLSKTTCAVTLCEDGVQFPVPVDRANSPDMQGTLATWAALEELAQEPNWCIELTDDPHAPLRPIRAYSAMTGWVRTLYPTIGAPTTLVSGIPMHRIQEVEPWEDTRRKVRAAAPQGIMLDTATGLGYSAIQAAAKAERVISVEIDPEALRLARRNPWSRDLFTASNIEVHIGDIEEVIETFEEHVFARVLHDPPAMSLAGELYSTSFYREVRRVLRRNGRLFHYIGDPESASGRNTTRGVMRRLQDAGFQRVERRPEAFGVTAQP